MMDYNIRDGHTYMYFKGDPLYPFGYGLSYTHFKYSGLRLSAARLAPDGKLSASFQVSNVGGRTGDEVVQMYVRHISSQVTRPKLELEGFQRVHLNAGQAKRVQLQLAAKRLAYWDNQVHGWRVEHDKIEIMVGSSSADIRLRQTISVVQ
jgi:beta-glucosidase